MIFSFRWLTIRNMCAAAAAASAACGTGDAVDAVGVQAADSIAGAPCDWVQVFGSSDHAGRACPELHGLRKIAEIVQDPDAQAEIDSNGFLQVHESPVVTFGDWVVIPTKSGFTDVLHQETVHYGVSTWRWTPSVSSDDARLVHAWDASTDFRTVDGAVSPAVTSGYVQQFGVAISHGSVYVPAASGRLLRLRLETGVLQAQIDPFAGTPISGDPRLILNSAPMVRPNGDVYVSAVAWSSNAQPVFVAPRGSWEVRVRPDDTSVLRDWSPDSAIRLTAGDPVASPSVGVPTLGSLCARSFGTGGTPGPTGPDSRPPLFRCGVQRPAVNAVTAYSAVTDHLVVFSYANNAPAGFLIELDADTLSPLRSADVQDNHLRYGCGVRFGSDAFPSCDVLTAGGTVNLGADPNFNGTIHLRLPSDIDDNSPTISPDGSTWTIGAYDGGSSFETLFGFPLGFDARGAMVAFHSDGTFAGNNPNFGWEVTESARCTAPGCLGFSFLQDDNRYSVFDLGLDQYASDFTLQNRTQIPGVPFGDFVDTHVVFGVLGDHYGTAESGFFFKMNASGQIVESVQLTDEPIEVLSGHVARDRAGRAYVTYAGLVHVIAGSSEPTSSLGVPVSPDQRRIARMQTARTAKFAGLAHAPEPPPLGPPR